MEKEKKGKNRLISESVVGCRYTVHQRRTLNSRTRVPIKLLDSLTCTLGMNTHFFQSLGTIGSWFSLLQEATGLSTGSSVFLKETSCRTFGRARIDYRQVLGAWSRLRSHETTLFFHPPLSSPLFTAITPIWASIPACNQNSVFQIRKVVFFQSQKN